MTFTSQENAPSGLVPSPPTVSLGEAALLYASVGWRVFPLGDDSKRPLTEHGYLDATTDPSIIATWWTVAPAARIGLALRPSGLLAVDVDPRNGGTTTFITLEARYGKLPRICHQRSGSGGEHVIMRDPSPGPEGWTRRQEDGGSIVGKLGAGVDLKCNGYVVVSPSGSYRWLALDPNAVPSVPEAWLVPMRKVDATRAPIAALTHVGDLGVEEWEESICDLTPPQRDELRAALDALPAPRQGRNATFQAIKTIFHDFGLSLDDGTSYLLDWHASHGSPRNARDLERQISRAADRPSDTPRGYRVGVASYPEFDAWLKRLRRRLDSERVAKTTAAFASKGNTERPRGATVSSEEAMRLYERTRSARPRGPAVSSEEAMRLYEQTRSVRFTADDARVDDARVDVRATVMPRRSR